MNISSNDRTSSWHLKCEIQDLSAIRMKISFILSFLSYSLNPLLLDLLIIHFLVSIFNEWEGGAIYICNKNFVQNWSSLVRLQLVSYTNFGKWFCLLAIGRTICIVYVGPHQNGRKMQPNSTFSVFRILSFPFRFGFGLHTNGRFVHY